MRWYGAAPLGDLVDTVPIVVVPAEDLEPVWRRLDDAVGRVRGASAHSKPELADALVHALDEAYRLWEAWKGDASLSNTMANAQVSSDPDGIVTAALVFARGGNTHDLVQPERHLGFGNQPFGTSPFGVGGWYFGSYAGDPKYLHLRWYKERAGWFAREVVDRPVLDPIEAACRWLEAQPAIHRP